jgi:omega-6 fatty acid desaturase (delta-12 desaturase)
MNLDNTTRVHFADTNYAEAKTVKPAWYWSAAKYGHSNLRKSSWQILNTLGPYALLWALMIFTVQQYPYWITLALALVAAGILVRVFILFHDCCHGSFFASRQANTILGYIAGVLTFTAFEDWRRVHNRHHATAGDLDRRGVGDIWTMTIEEYLAAPLPKRFAYRFYRNPFILLGPGSVLLFLVLHRFPIKGAGKKERASVLYTNLAILLIVGSATWTIGLPAYLLIQLPIILIAGSVGLWLFYIQHQFENVYWVRHDSWDPMRVALEGSSYFKLPKILQWFTGNIGLHHIHHVRPSIPNYNLQQCQDDVPAFQAVKPITLRTSLRSLRLSLCDVKNQRLVSFRSLPARRSKMMGAPGLYTILRCRSVDSDEP